MLKYIMNIFGIKRNCNVSDIIEKCEAPEEILTGRQMQEAEIWYYKHRNYVSSIVNDKSKFPPTDNEDKNEPSLWKPEHWNWFLEYYNANSTNK